MVGSDTPVLISLGAQTDETFAAILTLEGGVPKRFLNARTFSFILIARVTGSAAPGGSGGSAAVGARCSAAGGC